jgi:hypothetical protein
MNVIYILSIKHNKIDKTVDINNITGNQYIYCTRNLDKSLVYWC